MSTWTFTGSINQLRDLFDYDPDTGSLTWRARDERYAKDSLYATRWNSAHAGNLAQADDCHGYYQTGIAGKLYRTHRICYALAHDIDLTAVPPEVDHEDGIGTHNWKTNLRGTNRGGNAKNGKIRKRNKTGFKGVTFDTKSNGYRAHIMVDGRQYDQRGFATPQLAHDWYVAKSKELHKDFGCGNSNGTYS